MVDIGNIITSNVLDKELKEVFLDCMNRRNQLFQVFRKSRVSAKEILLFIKISNPKIKITSTANQRAIDEKRECINLLSFIDTVRATSYNNKYSFDFQVEQYFILLFKDRSSRLEVFCKKGVLTNFTKFTGKHLCQSLFFNKVAGLCFCKDIYLQPRKDKLELLKDINFKQNPFTKLQITLR